MLSIVTVAALLLLALLLHAGETHALGTILALQCRDSDDFARLFYLICSKEALCRELYNLDVPHHNNSWVYDHDFHSFQFQITQTFFFSTGSEPSEWDGQPMTAYIWPEAWQPPITLEYVGNTADVNVTPCSESVDLSGNTTESLLFISVSLDMMKSYRAFISNEHRCNDYNEQPIFDLATGEFYCKVISGKSTLSDADYQQLIFYITLITVGFTLVFLLAATLIGIKLLPGDDY